MTRYSRLVAEIVSECESDLYDVVPVHLVITGIEDIEDAAKRAGLMGIAKTLSDLRTAVLAESYPHEGAPPCKATFEDAVDVVGGKVSWLCRVCGTEHEWEILPDGPAEG